MKTVTKINRATRKVVPFKETNAAHDTQWIAQLMGYPTVAGVHVNERTVGGLPAIGRGVDMVSNAVATMMVGADVLRGGEVVATPQIVSRPNYLFGAYEFYAMVTASLMMRGNFIGILADFGPDGYPRQVIPVHPDSVTLNLETGFPIYRIDDQLYRYDEVVHIRANAPIGGLWGMGIVERYRAELEGALYEQTHGITSFKSGGVPPAVIQVDTDILTQEQVDAVQSGWIDRHGYGMRKPAVVGRKMSVTPIGWSAKDAEYVEGRKLTIAECALMCGLDPSDLSAAIGNSALTYANLTQRTLARISDSFAPWMNLIENAWSDLIPGGLRVRGNAEALLRTSTAERYELHRNALEAGWMTVDEVRAIENRAPLPKADAPSLEATDKQFEVEA